MAALGQEVTSLAQFPVRKKFPRVRFVPGRSAANHSRERSSQWQLVHTAPTEECKYLHRGSGPRSCCFIVRVPVKVQSSVHSEHLETVEALKKKGRA